MHKYSVLTLFQQDPTALRGGIGEKSLRQILAQADKVADRSLPPDRDAIKKLSGDISSMTDALCELRQDGKGTTPQVRPGKFTFQMSSLQYVENAIPLPPPLPCLPHA